MIKKPKIKSRNAEVLKDFVRFCHRNKELRFWQALRNWSGKEKIYAVFYDKDLEDDFAEDTFFYKGKDK